MLVLEADHVQVDPIPEMIAIVRAQPGVPELRASVEGLRQRLMRPPPELIRRQEEPERQLHGRYRLVEWHNARSIGRLWRECVQGHLRLKLRPVEQGVQRV